jgi:hypothetical protein
VISPFGIVEMERSVDSSCVYWEREVKQQNINEEGCLVMYMCIHLYMNCDTMYIICTHIYIMLCGPLSNLPDQASFPGVGVASLSLGSWRWDPLQSCDRRGNRWQLHLKMKSDLPDSRWQLHLTMMNGLQGRPPQL